MECCSWCVWNAAVRLEFFLVRQVFFSEGEDVKEIVWYVGFLMCVLVFVVPLIFFLGWVLLSIFPPGGFVSGGFVPGGFVGVPVDIRYCHNFLDLVRYCEVLLKILLNFEKIGDKWPFMG